MNVPKLLDFTSSILIVVSLSLVTYNYKFWLLYSLASICFLSLMIIEGLTGLTFMAAYLVLVGIKNYVNERRKHCKGGK